MSRVVEKERMLNKNNLEGNNSEGYVYYRDIDRDNSKLFESLFKAQGKLVPSYTLVEDESNELVYHKKMKKED